MSYHHFNVSTYATTTSNLSYKLNENALYEDTYVIDKWVNDGETKPTGLQQLFAVGMQYTFEYDIRTLVSGASIQSFKVNATSNCSCSGTSDVTIRNNRYIRFKVRPSSAGDFYVDLWTYSGTGQTGTVYKDHFNFGAISSSGYYNFKIDFNNGTTGLGSTLKTTNLRALRRLTSLSLSVYTTTADVVLSNSDIIPTRTNCTFNQWNTNKLGTGTSYSGTFTISSDTTVYAVWNTSIAFSATSGGSVSPSSMTAIVGASMTVVSDTTLPETKGTVTVGSNTVTATPDSNAYKFNNWSGTASTVSPGMSITASFSAKTQYTVTVQSSNTTYGTVSPTSLTVCEGDLVGSTSNRTLYFYYLDDYTGTRTYTTATTAASKYRFDGWSVPSTKVSGNMTVTANFSYPTYTVTLSAGTGGQIRKNGESSGSSTKTISGLEYNTRWSRSGNSITIGGVTYYAEGTKNYYSFNSWSPSSSSSGYITSDTSFSASFDNLRLQFYVYNRDYNDTSVTFTSYRFYTSNVYSDADCTTPVSSTSFTQAQTFYAIKSSASATSVTVDVDWTGSGGSSTSSPYYTYSNTTTMRNSSTGATGDSVSVSNGDYIYASVTKTYYLILEYKDSSTGNVMKTESYSSSSSTFSFYLNDGNSGLNKPSARTYYKVTKWTLNGSVYNAGTYIQNLSYNKYAVTSYEWARIYYTWTFNVSTRASLYGYVRYNNTNYSSVSVSIAAGMTYDVVDLATGAKSKLKFVDNVGSISEIDLYAILDSGVTKFIFPAMWQYNGVDMVHGTVNSNRTITVDFTQNTYTLHFSVEEIQTFYPATITTPYDTDVYTADVPDIESGTPYIIERDGTVKLGATPYTIISLNTDPTYYYYTFRYWKNGSGTPYVSDGSTIDDDDKTTWIAHFERVDPTSISITPSNVRILKTNSVTFTPVIEPSGAYSDVTWSITTPSWGTYVTMSSDAHSATITAKSGIDLGSTGSVSITLVATSVGDPTKSATATLTIVDRTVNYLVYDQGTGTSGLKTQQAYINQVGDPSIDVSMSGWQLVSGNSLVDANSYAGTGPLLLDALTYHFSYDLSQLSYDPLMPLPTLSGNVTTPTYTACTLANLTTSGTTVQLDVTPTTSSGTVHFEIDVTGQNYTLMYHFVIAHTDVGLTVTYHRNAESARFIDGIVTADGGTISTFDIPEDTRFSRDYGVFIVRSRDTVVRNGYTNEGWSTDDTSTAGVVDDGDLLTINEDSDLYAIWVTPINIHVTSGDHGYIKNDITDDTGSDLVMEGVPSTAKYSIQSSRVITYNSAVESQTYYQMSAVADTANGYVFSNWEIQNVGTDPPTTGYVTNGMAFHAVFMLQTVTFTLVYSAPGASNVPGSVTRSAAARYYTFTVSSTVPTKGDEIFQYWEDEGGNHYTPGSTITVNAPSEGASITATLTAVFSGSTTLHFNTTTTPTSGGDTVASSVSPTTVVLPTNWFPTPVMLDGYTFNGWVKSDGTSVNPSTPFPEGGTVELYIDAGTEDTCGATFTFARNINGITKRTTYHLPMVQSIEDTSNVNLTEISTIVFGAENRFVMDTGTSHRYTVDVIRTTPTGWSVVNDMNMRNIHKNTWGSDSFDDRTLSNAAWIEMFKNDLDMWQNFGVDPASGNRLGGFRFIFTPSSDTGMTDLYPTLDRNVFLSGSLNINYQYGKLVLSIPLQVATMIAGQNQAINTYSITLHSAREEKVINYPQNALIPIPNLPSEWMDSSGSLLFREWSDGDGTDYMPGQMIKLVDSMDLYAVWDEPAAGFIRVLDNPNLNMTENVDSEGTLIYSVDDNTGDITIETIDKVTMVAYVIGGGGGAAGSKLVSRSDGLLGGRIAGGAGGSGEMKVQKTTLSTNDLISYSIGSAGISGRHENAIRTPTDGSDGGDTTITTSTRFKMVAHGGAGGKLGSVNNNDPIYTFVGGKGGKTNNKGGNAGSCVYNHSDHSLSTVSGEKGEGINGGDGAESYASYTNRARMYVGGGGGASADIEMSINVHSIQRDIMSSGGRGGVYDGDEIREYNTSGYIGGGGGSTNQNINPGENIAGKGGAGAIILLFYKEEE